MSQQEQMSLDRNASGLCLSKREDYNVVSRYDRQLPISYWRYLPLRLSYL